MPYPENCMILTDFGIGMYLADVDCLKLGNGTVCERNILEFSREETSDILLSSYDMQNDIETSPCPSEKWALVNGIAVLCEQNVLGSVGTW